MSAVPDFPAFFEALWGHPPFPWQRRLAERVERKGWPSLLDIPTGLGKTAAIDMAVWHLAREAATRPRRAAVRIVYVVDRRLVVDQAAERAGAIARRLEEATDGPLAAVAAALRALAGDGPPLAVVRLRGGLPLEPDWVRTSHQPTVVLSTVDQAGSRLLFRGYGVSNRMWPVHAGLLGSDVLWLLDEAHLSRPFVQTLEAVERLRGALAEEDLGLPFGVVQLSATAPGAAGGRFGLEAEDLANAEIRRRIGASKPARLEQVEGGGEALVAAAVGEARRMLEDGRRRVGVVVNRVGRARAVFEELRRTLSAKADVLLAIGRIRPLDREALARELEARLRPADAAHGPPAEERPVVVVGTQTLEVGADFDLDALITEIAPLDALRQRFGRLDRRGRLGTASAVILARKEGVRKNAEDPVYGNAAAATWRWLCGKAEKRRRVRIVDFGVAALEELLEGVAGEELAELLAPRSDAPLLLPAHVRALAATSPPPAAAPEVALYLHGPGAGPADVRIVWRANLAEKDLNDPQRAREIAAALPPASPEALEVPVWVARAWLAERTADFADVEGGRGVEDREPEGPGRRALRWRGPDDESTGVISPREIRPGDTLVVPARYGGCDRFGWNPRSCEPVEDLAEPAFALARGRPAVRLHPALARTWGDPEDDPRTEVELWSVVRAELEELGDAGADELVANLLARDDLPAGLRARLEEIAPLRARLLRPYGAELARGCVLVARRRARRSEEAVSESDVTSLSAPGPAPLADHLERVRRKAVDFAERIGLAEPVRAALERAAHWHDLGKAEPRFQAFLRGGDRIAALVEGDLLAKSDRRLDVRQAAELAGLPGGIRHEVWSVVAAQRLLEGEADGLHDLVLWLVGTHHGHGRPFFPPVEDGQAADFAVALVGLHVEGVPGDPGLHRLDSFWFELAERLRVRFGPWQLASLEALVRLADHRVSGEEAGG